MKDYNGGMIMHDKIEIIGKGTLIQHGRHNNRIYLMKLDEQDAPIILEKLSELAHKNEYTKIFCKIPKWIAPIFLSNEYISEASIPGFYNKTQDVFFVSKFIDSSRLLNVEKVQFEKMSLLLEGESRNHKKLTTLKSDYKIRRLDNSDVEQITDIYKEVFISYPFPIHDSGYILQTMDENVQYYGAEKDGRLAAIASSEIDSKGSNAEMTDFATSKEYLGNNLSALLLEKMEKEMKKQEIRTLYTIARLNSIPMNKTFLKFNYCYSGTLINNTNISGSIESMNVYYKHL
jgi:putative beta-lysine N-acetyltransferase